MHKQLRNRKHLLKCFVTNPYVQKKNSQKTSSPLKQSAWQLTLEQGNNHWPGLSSHVLIQRKEVKHVVEILFF